MEEFFLRNSSNVFAVFGPIFESALQAELPRARLMSVITPGTSDNRWFRRAGIPVVGFFPLDLRNSLGGIHGNNEYISEASLSLAWRVISRVLDKLADVLPSRS